MKDRSPFPRLAVLAILSLAGGGGVAHAQEPIVLKFGVPVPAQSWPNMRGAAPFAQAVEKDSGGLLKFQIFNGNSVVTQRNAYDRLMNGVVDAIYGAFAEVPGTFKKATVPGLPFEVNRAVDASVAFWRLYEKGIIADELASVKPLALYGFNPSGIQSHRLIRKAEDLNGIKLAVLSHSAAEALTLLGGTPVTMSPSEMYQSILRGLTQGAILGWTGTQTFKLDEVTTYHLDVPFGNNPGYMLMSKDAYARLPDKLKAAVDKHAGFPFSLKMGRNSDQVEEESRARVRAKSGHTLSVLDPEEAKRWRKILAPITEEWVKNTPDGAAVLGAYRREVAVAAKEIPDKEK